MSLDAIKDAFALTEEDLAANREGRLSPAQAARAAKATGDDATFMAGFAALFACVMYGILWFIWDSGAFSRMSGGPMGAALVVVLAAGFPTAAIAWAIWTLIVHFRSRGSSEAASVEGELEVRTRRYKGVALHEVVVDGEVFVVTPRAQAALRGLRRGRLYYAPTSKVVVGAEPIDE